MHSPTRRLSGLPLLLVVALGLTGCSTSGSGPAPGSGRGEPSTESAGVSAGSTSGPVPTSAPTTAPDSTTPPPAALQLPGGGTRVLPDHRLVGFSGAPGTPTLGRLTGDLTVATQALQQQASAYQADLPVLPVFELIATTAHASPGPDGMYRSRASDATVDTYLEAARAVGGILLLDIQPGRADFLPEVQAYEKWLREPDVGVALDPEWAVAPDAVPGQSFGSTDGAELEAVAGYLDGLVQAGNLPQKVMVYHQVTASVVADEGALQPHPDLALVKSVDGIGSPAMKVETWNELMLTKPTHVAAGFKLFYAEDAELGPVMSPEEVMALQPVPEYVLYE